MPIKMADVMKTLPAKSEMSYCGTEPGSHDMIPTIHELVALREEHAREAALWGDDIYGIPAAVSRASRIGSILVWVIPDRYLVSAVRFAMQNEACDQIPVITEFRAHTGPDRWGNTYFMTLQYAKRGWCCTIAAKWDNNNIGGDYNGLDGACASKLVWQLYAD